MQEERPESAYGERHAGHLDLKAAITFGKNLANQRLSVHSDENTSSHRALTSESGPPIALSFRTPVV